MEQNGFSIPPALASRPQPTPAVTLRSSFRKFFVAATYSED
jgi:hypothetical protein